MREVAQLKIICFRKWGNCDSITFKNRQLSTCLEAYGQELPSSHLGNWRGPVRQSDQREELAGRGRRETAGLINSSFKLGPGFPGPFHWGLGSKTESYALYIPKVKVIDKLTKDR